jgi:hypothetical protein
LFEYKYPHGQGLLMAMSIKFDGKVTFCCALEMIILLSSNGCLRDYKAYLLNSGISSKNSTPLCARLISPGFRLWTPPIIAISLAV